MGEEEGVNALHRLSGRAAVRERHTDHVMARETWAVYERVAAGSVNPK